VANAANLTCPAHHRRSYPSLIAFALIRRKEGLPDSPPTLHKVVYACIDSAEFRTFLRPPLRFEATS